MNILQRNELNEKGKRWDRTSLEVGLDLDKEFLEVLNDRAVDGATEIGVLIGHLPGFVADTVKDILE